MYICSYGCIRFLSIHILHPRRVQSNGAVPRIWIQPMDALDDPACCIYDRFFGNLCRMTMPILQTVIPAFITMVKSGLVRISQPSDHCMQRSQPFKLFQCYFFLFFYIHSAVSLFSESNFLSAPLSNECPINRAIMVRSESITKCQRPVRQRFFCAWNRKTDGFEVIPASYPLHARGTSSSPE